jgi:hypothetical protein
MIYSRGVKCRCVKFYSSIQNTCHSIVVFRLFVVFILFIQFIVVILVISNLTVALQVAIPASEPITALSDSASPSKSTTSTLWQTYRGSPLLPDRPLSEIDLDNYLRETEMVEQDSRFASTPLLSTPHMHAPKLAVLPASAATPPIFSPFPPQSVSSSKHIKKSASSSSMASKPMTSSLTRMKQKTMQRKASREAIHAQPPPTTKAAPSAPSFSSYSDLLPSFTASTRSADLVNSILTEQFNL